MKKLILLLMLGVMLFAAASETKPLTAGFMECAGIRTGIVWRHLGPYRKFKENGVTANEHRVLPWFMGKVSEQQIYNTLKQYHVVIPDVFRGHLALDYDKLIQNYKKALVRYAREGGGVVIVASSPGYTTDRRDEIFNHLFADFGLYMTKEGVCDLKNEYQYPDHPFLSHKKVAAPSYLRFFKTSAIADSPVTKGVKNIYFPQWGDCGMWGAMLLKFSPQWKVVVRGEKSAKSYLPETLESKHSFYQKPGSVKTAPPLAAYRDFGKGRIFVISANSMHVFDNCYAAGWPGVFEHYGDGKTPSDGHKLLFNAIHYVGNNARKNPALGNYKEKNLNLTLTFPAKSSPGAAAIPALPSGEWKGLIGIRTRLSGGKGRVADFVREAKKHNIRFLVFTELFENMDAAKFAQLKKECAAVSNADFYACPGLEFPDGNGLRWVVWGERVPFPQQSVLSADGKRVHRWGVYISACGRAPNGPLDFNALRKIADPANLWWYSRIPAVVRRDGKTLFASARDFDFGLADLRGIGVYAFCGISDPGKIGKEHIFNIIPGGKVQTKTWLNTKNIDNCHLGYPSSGPRITAWGAANAFNQFLHNRTAGTQRIRSKIAVSSDDGIRDIAIYAAPGRLLRRFDVGGKKSFSTEFELVHDRRMDVYAVVTDIKGKKAFSPSWKATMFFYDISRCTDNLNLLGYSTMHGHPDRHDYPASMREFEAKSNPRQAVLVGIDTSAEDDGSFYPYASLVVNCRTTEGIQFWGNHALDNFSAHPVRFNFTGSGVSKVSSNSTFRVSTRNRHIGKQRKSYSEASIFPNTGKQPLFNIKLESYLLRSRIMPHVSLTAYWLAADDYQGGAMIHNITLTAQKDVVLKGDIPLEMLTCHIKASEHFNQKQGYGTRIIADTVSGIVDQAPSKLRGILKDGGFLTVTSEKSPRKMIIVAGGSKLPIRFTVRENGMVMLGLGTAGMKIAKGTEIKFNCAVLSATANFTSADQLQALAKIYRVSSGNGLHVLQASGGAVKFTADAEPFAICDTAFAIKNVEDNGSACYYEFNGTRRFIPSPVENNTLYFQTDARKKCEVWAGNLFLCDKKEIRITPVLYGLAKGQKPFIEIHNPTDKKLFCQVTVPVDAPEFGGMKIQAEIPAGSSVFKELK